MSILITLTEDPLLRSWLYADKGKLLSKIASQKPIFILGSEKEEIRLKEFLNINKLDLSRIQLIIFKNKSLNFNQKFLGSILRWSQKSEGSKRLRYLFFEKGKFGFFGLLTRNLLANTIGSSRKLLQFVRWVYGLDIDSYYSKLIESINCDLVICTSLTDTHPDAELLKAAKKKKLKTVGTPRSWDNLVSHGALRVIPDKFLSHSQYMTECALKYQFIEKGVIFETGTSTYRKEFLPNCNKYGSRDQVSIAIGCVGPNSNPSEFAFIVNIIPKIQENFPNIAITIIQHPRFLHREKFEFTNVKDISFEFTEFDSLKHYYETLSEFDLLLTSGSTIGLDAAFVGIPVECFFVDLVDVGYWASSTRYLTHRTHYKDFINILKIKTHFSIESVLFSIDSISNGYIPEVKTPVHFTGYPKLNFNLAILNSLGIKS